MQHPVGSVSLWCLTLNKQTCVLLFQITFSFILLTFHRDTCCVVLGCTKVFQPLVRQFFLLPDYKTCICRGNFLLSREFRRQFPDNLWRGPNWGNVAPWVSSAIVLCGVILRKWPRAVIIIDASSLSILLLDDTVSGWLWCKIWHSEDWVTGSFNQSSSWHHL